MSTENGSRDVKVYLDPELANAIATARRQDRTTTAGFIRNAVIRTLREAGLLPPAGSSISEASR